LAILSCPGCGRGGLRVPDGRRGKVTCPTCGAEWFHPETIELSDVEFRCSKSGARFNVISSRRSPLHKFVIQKINKAMDGASRSPKDEPFHWGHSHHGSVRPLSLLPRTRNASTTNTAAENQQHKPASTRFPHQARNNCESGGCNQDNSSGCGIRDNRTKKI
jgi:hypothetical protein